MADELSVRARNESLIRQAIADGLLPDYVVVGGPATPLQIVEAAMAGTLFYAGLRPMDGPADLLDIAADDLTWSVMLEDMSDTVSEMKPGRARHLIERLLELRIAITTLEPGTSSGLES